MDAASWHCDELCRRIIDTGLHSDILSYLNNHQLTTVNSLTQSGVTYLSNLPTEYS